MLFDFILAIKWLLCLCPFLKYKNVNTNLYRRFLHGCPKWSWSTEGGEGAGRSLVQGVGACRRQTVRRWCDVLLHARRAHWPVPPRTSARPRSTCEAPSSAESAEPDPKHTQLHFAGLPWIRMNMDISTCGYQAILWIYPWIFLRHLIWTVTSLILNISYFRLPYNSAQQKERKFAQMYNIIAKRLFISAMHNIWQKSANFFKSNLFPNVSNYQKITHPRQDCHFVTNVIATPNPTTLFTA